MNRMFPVFALLAVTAVAAAMIMGLTLGDFHSTSRSIGEVRARLSAAHLLPPAETEALRAKDAELRKLEAWASWHRRMGFGAGIFVLWASSLSVVYFLGTSRWCREVTEAYQFPLGPLQRSLQLKRRAFAFSTLAMLTAVVMVALGGANDPSSGRQGTKEWVQVHFYGAMLGIPFLIWCFTQIYGYIIEHQRILHEVMASVREERSRRNQDVG